VKHAATHWREVDRRRRGRKARKAAIKLRVAARKAAEAEARRRRHRLLYHTAKVKE
jgi:hypothetical protein